MDIKRERVFDGLKIAISGSHGTGKTTLLNRLNRRYDINMIPEITRKLGDRGFEIGKDGNNALQLALCAKYTEHIEGNDEFVMDRCPIDSYAYTWINYKDGKDISDHVESFVMEHTAKYTRRFDVVAYCPIEFELEDDGVRPQEERFQERVADQILRLLKKLSEKGHIDLIELSGSVREREFQLTDYLWEEYDERAAP